MAVKNLKKKSTFKDIFYTIENKSMEAIGKIYLSFLSMAVFSYI
jgi:hypothetical protein